MTTTPANNQRQYADSEVKQAAAAIARELGPDARAVDIGTRLQADFSGLDFGTALMIGLQTVGQSRVGQDAARELEAAPVRETGREPQPGRRRRRRSHSRRSVATGRIGRPKLPEGTRREYRLQIRLSQAERATIERAAELVGLPASEWIRDAMLRLIDRRMPECGEETGRQRPSG